MSGALEDYLVEAGLDGATLTLANGEARAGADLRALVEEARALRGSSTACTRATIAPSWNRLRLLAPSGP